MTNTKFRKRALLSSVAMLLVALVALGSATFAWFTEDPNANAHGIAAYAQTSKGLLISTDTDTTPSHSAQLAKNVSGIYLAPATTNDGTAYKTIDAATASAHTLDTSKSWSNATMVDGRAGTGVYRETMTLQMTTPPTGTDTQKVYLRGLDIRLSNAAHKMQSALVVTLSYGSTVKYYSVSGDDVATWTTLTGTGSTTTTATLTVDQENETFGTAVEVGTFSASTTTIPVEIYVWLNGEDSSVYTDNSDASQLIDQICCYFSLNATGDYAKVPTA